MTVEPPRTVAAHRVVVVGSGFGGLFATRRLDGAPDVTIIDRRTHHLFQPLLYQVATGILSQGDVAPATREILRRQRNARVLLGEDLQGFAAGVWEAIFRAPFRPRHGPLWNAKRPRFAGPFRNFLDLF